VPEIPNNEASPFDRNRVDPLAARRWDELLPQQQELFSLLKQTFRRSWGEWIQQQVSKIIVPLALLFFIVATALMLVVIHVLVALLSEVAAQITIWLTVGLFFYLAFTRTEEAESSVIRRSTDELYLGRLGEAFDTNRLELPLMGMLIGSQFGLLACGDWHMGLRLERMSVGMALGYTFDNFVQAIFGDVCELYGWRVMPEFRHTFWSATTFNLFRIAASILTLLWIRMEWHHFLARGLFRRFPTKCNVPQIVAWLRGLSQTERSWMLSHFDEFLFLRIVGEYLAGDFAAVTRLSNQFPRLRVDEDLRRLFVDAEGKALFEGFRLD
jgi:hypothetical protein